jgi:hypothetical protein
MGERVRKEQGRGTDMRMRSAHLDNNAIMNNDILSVCLDPEWTFPNPYWSSPHQVNIIDAGAGGTVNSHLLRSTEGAIARYIDSHQSATAHQSALALAQCSIDSWLSRAAKDMAPRLFHCVWTSPGITASANLLRVQENGHESITATVIGRIHELP